MNDKQAKAFRQITWLPETGPTGWSFDTVANVNGCRVILYPSGKLDILSVADSPGAREYEAALRKHHGSDILGHVGTYRTIGGHTTKDHVA